MLQALRDPLRVFTDYAVQPVSYIVFADGSRYYAKNGSTGVIEYSDTDPLNVLNYVVSEATGKDVIVVKGAYNLRGRVWVINKPDLVVLGYGATIVNGGVRLEGAHGTFFAGFTFTYGAPGVPCIHRKTTIYSTIADIYMQNVDIGIVEESTDKVNIVNRAYNIHIEWANTVGARFANSGLAGNNLNTYYGLFIHGGGTGVEFTGPDPNNPQNQGNQFFGLWLEDLQTGIKYYNALRTTIYGVWFEKNTNYDIDIGQGGYNLVVLGVLYPARGPTVNNPYGRAYSIYHNDIIAGSITPGRICGQTGCGDSNPYILLPDNIVFNIGRGYAFRFWQNGGADGELRMWFDARTKRAIIRAMADPGIVLGTAGGRVDKITMYPHTSLPSTDDEGSLRLYYDGTSYKLCVYAGGSWKCTTLS
jgi:hypothetical protein